MARAAVKAKQQAARTQAQPVKPARGRRRHAGGGNPNQDLFFMRLRRRQKWVYVFLALIFMVTFAGVGVGSGTGGLSDLYSGLFGGGGNSISQAKAEIKKDPAKGYHDLANAYQAKGDTPSAINALRTYLRLKPKDASMWTVLAGLELTQAQTYVQQYQQAQQAGQFAAPGTPFQPSGALGQQLGTDPVTSFYAQQASSRTSQLYTQATTTLSSALKDYQTVAKLQPHNAQVQAQIAQVAQNEGNYALAVSAYRKYLKLYPSSPQKAQIEQLIKQMSALLPKPAPAKK